MPIKIWEKRERESNQGLRKISKYPLISQELVSYGLQIWPVHSQGPSEQKPINIVGEK